MVFYVTVLRNNSAEYMIIISNNKHTMHFEKRLSMNEKFVV